MKITFLSPVRHDGKDYADGDSVEMDATAAATLIEAGVGAPSGKKSEKPAGKTAASDNDTSNNDGQE